MENLEAFSVDSFGIKASIQQLSVFPSHASTEDLFTDSIAAPGSNDHRLVFANLSEDGDSDNNSFASQICQYQEGRLFAPIKLTEAFMGKVIGSHYSPIDQSLALGFADGRLCFVHLSSILDHADYSSLPDLEIEEMGTFPDGIVAFACSPNGQQIAVVTGNLSFQLLERNSLESIFELNLIDSIDVFQSTHVSVNWGRRETQFHGSAGKKAALSSISIHQSFPPPPSHHQGRLAPQNEVLLSWNRDNLSIACSFPITQKSHREIVVISTEHHNIASIKEPIPLLHPTLAWCPSSDFNMIATTSSARNPCPSQISTGSDMDIMSDGAGQHVVFLEPNGLYLSSFLCPQTACIRKLQWNADGSILAVFLEDQKMQLWSMCNYHWYCRMELLNCASLQWDPINPMVLWDGLDQRILLHRHVASGDDLCAVVDHKRLLLTPFAVANIPPPMYWHCIQMEHCANATAVCLFLEEFDQKVYHVAALQSTGHLAVWKLVISKNKMSSCELMEIRDGMDPLAHLMFDGNKQLMVSRRGFRLIHPHFQMDLDTGAILDFSGSILMDSMPICTELIHYEQDFEHFFIGRTMDDSLNINGQVISDDCTSILMHRQFLCCTDRRGLVRFIAADRIPLLDSTSIFKDSAQWTNEQSRLIEPGARLVCASDTNTSQQLVLQILPRGNLEIIAPRIMLLQRITQMLVNREYLQAFQTCRRHRINLNILYDLNPKLLLASMDRFVEQIGNPEHLNLFLGSLKPENISRQLYSSMSFQDSDPDSFGTFKLDNVCINLRDSVIRLHGQQGKYGETIMTSYVCQSNRDCRSALQFIQDHLEATESESQLKYLLFLATHNELYRTALEMYNLPMALSIARRSQMDPNDYLPFLEGLYGIREKWRQLYQIDVHLCRHALALESLVHCSDATVDEVVSFVEKRQMYAMAFEVLLRNRNVNADLVESSFKSVCALFAQHVLVSESDPLVLRTAVHLYAFAGHRDGVVSAASSTGAWREMSIVLVDMSQTDVSQMDASTSCVSKEDDAEAMIGKEGQTSACIGDLTKALCAQSKHAEAIRYLECSRDWRSACLVAMQGDLWLDALFFFHQLDKTPLDLNFGRSVEERSVCILNELDDIADAFDSKCTRLGTVISELIAALSNQIPMQPFMMSDSHLDDGKSEMSFRSTASTTISSIVSQLSSLESCSAKSRRKQRQRGKEGSIFERVHLRDQLEESMKRLAVIEDLSKTQMLPALGLLRLFDQARLLQSKLLNCLSMVQGHKRKIKELLIQQDACLKTQTCLDALNIASFGSIPDLLLVDHHWMRVFDESSVDAPSLILPYLPLAP